jgi:hypothetical protein
VKMQGWEGKTVKGGTGGGQLKWLANNTVKLWCNWTTEMLGNTAQC